MSSDYIPEEFDPEDRVGTPPLRERAAPQPKKKGCGVWILVAVAAFFFVCTLLLFVALVGTTMSEAGLTTGEDGLDGERFMVSTIEGTGAAKILIIPISGIIADMPSKGLAHNKSGLVSTVTAILKQARKDAEVRAIILSIDSPGGGITASDILYHQIAEFHRETGIPIVALLGDVAASGGYYVAATAERIVAHPTTITGSIGVVMPWLSAQGLLQKIGIESHPIKSGEKKDIGSIARSMSDEERVLLQTIVDEYHKRFVTVVHEGFKKRKVKTSRSELEAVCDGRVFTGEQARQLGFVDEIGYFEDAVHAARDVAGVSAADSRVIIYQRRPTLLDMILAKSSAPRAATVTLDFETIRQAAAPRFQYLWTVGEGSPAIGE